jgi:hypothetical protein
MMRLRRAMRTPSRLLRRAMVEDTLKGAKSTRYRHAARHLA